MLVLLTGSLADCVPDSIMPQITRMVHDVYTVPPNNLHGTLDTDSKTLLCQITRMVHNLHGTLDIDSQTPNMNILGFCLPDSTMVQIKDAINVVAEGQCPNPLYSSGKVMKRAIEFDNFFPISYCVRTHTEHSILKG